VLVDITVKPCDRLIGADWAPAGTTAVTRVAETKVGVTVATPSPIEKRTRQGIEPVHCAPLTSRLKLVPSIVTVEPTAPLAGLKPVMAGRWARAEPERPQRATRARKRKASCWARVFMGVSLGRESWVGVAAWAVLPSGQARALGPTGNLEKVGARGSLGWGRAQARERRSP